MKFAREHWLNSSNIKNQPVGGILRIESLEDRIVPTVTVSDFSDRWLPAFVNQVSSALVNGAAMTRDIPILQKNLGQALAAANGLGDVVSNVQTEAAGHGNDPLKAFLQNLSADGITVDSVGTVVPDPNDATRQSLSFILVLDPADKSDSIDGDPSEVGQSFSHLSLSLDNGITFTLTNDLKITVSGSIDEVNQPEGSPASLRYSPTDTSADYQPTLAANPITFGGKIGSSAITYSASISPHMNGDVNFDFGPGTDAALSMLTQTTTTTDLKLSLDLTARLTAGPLPPLGYQQSLTYDFTTGGSPTLSTAKILITVSSQDYDVNSPQGRAALAEQILGGAALNVVQAVDDAVPDQVSNFLLGEDANGNPVEVFGVPIKEVLGGQAPIDILKDASNLVGPEAPTVIQLIKDVLLIDQFGQLLRGVNSSNTDELEQKGDDLGLSFPVLDDPLGSVTRIFQGDPTVDLVKFKIDFIDELAKAYSVPVDQLLTIPGIDYLVKKDSDGILVLDVNIPPVSKQDILNGLMKDIDKSLGGEFAKVADFITGVAFSAIPDFTFNLEFKARGGIVAGVDTNFLASSDPTSDIASGFYIQTGDMLNLSLHGGFTVGPVSGADVVAGPIGGKVVDTVAQGAGKIVGAFGGNGDQATKTVESFVPTGTLSMGIDGDFVLGVSDGAVQDGRLRLDEVGSIGDLLSKLYGSGDLSVTIGASGDLLGGHASFGPLTYYLIPPIAFGSVRGPDNNPGGGSPTNGATTPDPFAELDPSTGILQIYGSGGTDQITVDRVGDQIRVTRGTRSLTGDGFNTFDVSAITRIELDLDGMHLTRVHPGTDPADGGNDNVHIDPSVPSDIPVEVFCGTGNNTVMADDGAGTYFGGEMTVHGNSGNDSLYGSGGLTDLEGGDGNDQLYAGPGFAFLIGGDGTDLLQGPTVPIAVPSDSIAGVYVGGSGDDELVVGNDADARFILIGGDYDQSGAPATDPGDNILLGGQGDDILIGGNAYGTLDDPTPVLTADHRAIIFGGPGNDAIYGQGGQFDVSGQIVGDLLVGGDGRSTGDAGHDSIEAGDGNDLIFAGNLAFDSNGNASVDQTMGGSADVQGEGGDDTIFGGRDNDSIDGGDGNDTIDAGLGVNTINGGNDDDTFILGRGIDTANGDGGNDTFILTNPSGTIYTPGGFITIDGGGQSGDVLQLVGGGDGSDIETYTSGSTGSDGLITTTPAVGNLVQSIRFSTLAEIQDTVFVASLSVFAPATADQIAIGDGGVLDGDDASEVSSNHFTPIWFTHKSAVDVDAGGGSDVVTVDNPNPAFGLESLAIHGGGGADQITVKSTPDSVATSINGDAGNDTITVQNGSWLTIQSPLAVDGGGGLDTLAITGDPFVDIARETLVVDGTGSGRVVFDRTGAFGIGSDPDAAGTDTEQVNYSDFALINDDKPLTTGQLDVFLAAYGGTVAVTDGAMIDGAVSSQISGSAPTIQFARKPTVTINLGTSPKTVLVDNPTAPTDLGSLKIYSNELPGASLIANDEADDVFNIRRTSVPTSVIGQGGDETFTVATDAPGSSGNVNGIAASLTIDGGRGTSTLTVSDFSSATANSNAQITATQITGFAGPTDASPINYSNIEDLTVLGSNSIGDHFTVTSPSANLTLETEGGADFVQVQSLTLPAEVDGGAGSDQVTVGNASHSLNGIQAALTIDGGSASDTLTVDDAGTSAGQTYGLTSTTLTRTGIATIKYDAIEVMQVNGGSGANLYNVASTGAATSTTVDDGNSGSVFMVQGDQLVGANTFRGHGGDDSFTLNVGTGVTGTALTFDGGPGADDLLVNSRVGDDVVTLRVTSTVGNGTIAGLGQLVGFLTLEDIHLNAEGGSNSLAWIDDTNSIYGTALTPEDGIIVRPMGAASGDVRFGLSGKFFPHVSFEKVNQDFSVDGDGDGSGDKDVVTVLAPSTTGLQSSFGEILSPDGSNEVQISDQMVTIDNAALGTLRSVALAPATGSASFSTLVARTGNQLRSVGDDVTATPSNRLNILVDGMGPTSGRPGDHLTVATVGSRTIVRSTDPLNGPVHARIVQDSDGASVGFMHFEVVAGTQVALTGTGPNTGGDSQVLVYDPTTGKPRYAPITPFLGFNGGLTVASADVNGDSIPDVVVGAGPGGGPIVSVYDGIDGILIGSFYAYNPVFRNGLTVAAADVDGDGYSDIITGAGAGGAPHVKVFSGANFSELDSFYAYDASFRNGVSVAAGYTNATGFANIITGAGAGGAPHVKVFDGRTEAEVESFFAFDSRSRGGVNVGSGDLTGDYLSEIIVGAGPGDEPKVRVFSPVDGSMLADFWVNSPFDPNALPQIPLQNGVRVGATDLNGDGVADLLAGEGPGTQPIMYGYTLAAKNLATKQVTPMPLTEVSETSEFGPSYGWGLFVGGSD